MMGYNKSLLAFDDLREIFQKALNAKRGVRIPCNNHEDAMTLRSRFNYLRKLDRQENLKTYQPDDYMYGRSAWDRLVLRIPTKGSEDDRYVYIEKRSTDDHKVEELE